MPIFFGRHYFEKVASGGNIVINTSPERGLLRHIIVQPDSGATTYDFSIGDGSSLDLYYRESTTGTLNETVEIPVQSALVIKVISATIDENFKIYLAVQEL